MAHNNFPNVELYACKRWYRVTQEGPAAAYFTKDSETEEEEVNVNVPEEINPSVDGGNTIPCDVEVA